ncbi:MAG TPA: response regulator transcription factor [Acidimicrobiales bacterium]|nr:response regulator transcription factor [Acidimicrobiales bacterium]
MTLGTQSRTVLVAEDQTGMRTLVHRLIDFEDGFEVVAEATTGQEVLDKAAALRPDVVVLDLGMPVVDGEVVLAQLRAMDRFMMIVVLSGQASAIIQPRLTSLGADAVIEKGAANWEADLMSHLRVHHQA